MKRNKKIGFMRSGCKVFLQSCKKQNNDGYLQKKNSPKIFTDLVKDLSDEQKNWVQRTGFGPLLNFKSSRYRHRLGYKIIESFDPVSCTLKLNAGPVKITSGVVKKVLGLPKGNKSITFFGKGELFELWADLFKPKPYYHVTAKMLCTEIRKYAEVNKLFKFNFLVLMINFLVESHINGFVNCDILGMCGDLDACYQYNCCELLINSPKSTHHFWVMNPSKRYFVGPLSFLVVR